MLIILQEMARTVKKAGKKVIGEQIDKRIVVDRVILNEENFLDVYYRFQHRQAGVSISYCPEKKFYLYNAYCIDIEQMNELLSYEYSDLDSAIEVVKEEFGHWPLFFYQKPSSCGKC